MFSQLTMRKGPKLNSELSVVFEPFPPLPNLKIFVFENYFHFNRINKIYCQCIGLATSKLIPSFKIMEKLLQPRYRHFFLRYVVTCN